MRRRAAIALGGLAGRIGAAGRQLVTAHDVDGAAWWIPADGVWTDVDRSGQRPSCRPTLIQPIGLATNDTPEQAVLAGLSDRLGWEAMHAFGHGHDLPLIDLGLASHEVVVLDGRLTHDVPTVVVMGERVLRWAAGATWQLAVHRALYRSTGGDDAPVELKRVVATLGDADLAVASVDLGTASLRQAGVFRRSVQLASMSDEAGRTWDADRVD